MFNFRDTVRMRIRAGEGTQQKMFKWQIKQGKIQKKNYSYIQACNHDHHQFMYCICFKKKFNNQINNKIKKRTNMNEIIKETCKINRTSGRRHQQSFEFSFTTFSFFSNSLWIFSFFFFKAEVCTYTKHVWRTRFISLFRFFLSRFLLSSSFLLLFPSSMKMI